MSAGENCESKKKEEQKMRKNVTNGRVTLVC